VTDHKPTKGGGQGNNQAGGQGGGQGGGRGGGQGNGPANADTDHSNRLQERPATGGPNRRDLETPASEQAAPLPYTLDDAVATIEATITDWLSVEAYQAILASGHTPRMLATAILAGMYGPTVVTPLLTYPATKRSPFETQAP
jgi:hypothetical protein